MAKPLTDIEIAIRGMYERRLNHAKYWQYYDGDQRSKFISEKLKELYGSINTDLFTQNWCDVIVTSAKDRMCLDGWRASGDSVENQLADAALEALWDDLHLSIEADEIHEACLVVGEAFLMVWQGPDGDICASFNDSRNCHVEYGGYSASDARFGAKVWRDPFGYHRLEMYYPDRFEYYISANSQDVTNDTLPAANDFRPVSYSAATIAAQTGADPATVVDVAPNTLGRIPLFHFRTGRRNPHGDFKKIIPLQDSVNTILNNMMVAAEAAAFPQRYAITNAGLDGLKSGAGRVWEIPAGDSTTEGTQVGQFQAAELGNYINALQSTVMAIASISRTPKHFFVGQGGDPSGEALIAMEAPLNKRVKSHIKRFSAVWEEVAAFLLELSGMPLATTDIDANYDKVESVLPITDSTVRKTNVDAGIPLVTVLRREGWSQSELDQLAADQEAAASKSAAAFTAAAMGAQNNFNSGLNPGADPLAAQPVAGQAQGQAQGVMNASAD